MILKSFRDLNGCKSQQEAKNKKTHSLQSSVTAALSLPRQSKTRS